MNQTNTDPPGDSPWLDHKAKKYPAVADNLEADVVVIGGGITGVTTAWLMRQAGQRVALIERGRIGDADSGHTTAHLTYVTDTRLHELVRHFGEDGARALWEAEATAMDQIEAIVEQAGVDCNFRRIPGYLHAPLDEARRGKAPADEIDLLRKDADLAGSLGFKSRLVERIPQHDVPGIEFDNQAAFDPGRYLATLASRIGGRGSHLFEQTELESIEDSPRRVVTTSGHEIACRYIVLATHNPLSGSVGAVRSGLFQTKLALYTSYVVGARVPSGTVPDVLLWDTADPYDYLRIEPRDDHQLVIFGGADVKTGQGDDERAYAALEARLAMRLPDAQVTRRWLGQVIETPDGLPYMGEHADGEFIATGYSGNGYTFGTLAAMMARDAFLGRDNPWKDLLRVDRKPFHGGIWHYLTENLDYPKHLLRDRLVPAGISDVTQVPVGAGRVVSLQQGKCAVYRDNDGSLSICSAVCTHLGCLVRWNAADDSWDCPCHGSRFSPTGEVLSGPAEEPLQRIELPR